MRMGSRGLTYVFTARCGGVAYAFIGDAVYVFTAEVACRPLRGPTAPIRSLWHSRVQTQTRCKSPLVPSVSIAPDCTFQEQ